jgi:large subunit ribosomal protein L20
MTRVKRGIVIKKRHKKLLKQTKGFWGQRKNIFKRAKETLLRALAFSFKGRKLRKRDMRSLFIMRISAAAVAHGTKYNSLMHGLKKADIKLNRKMLSQIAIYDPATFTHIVQLTQAQP